ncbi:MAG: efflux RND transporter periplasmic adaptor subunit [Planctomycetota bacterium]
MSDLGKLRIDRSKTKSSVRRKQRRPWVKPLVWAVVLGGAFWLLRAPILRTYDNLTLPRVETASAIRTNPLAATAVSGTAANGYIVAARQAALSADTPGRVVEMNVEEGSVVKKGDVVARLYAKEYDAAVRAAEAQLDSAKAGVTRSEKELEAARTSVARRQAELSAARTQLISQQSNVAAAESRVEDVESLVELALLEFDRQQQLLRKEAGTQQALDEARTRLQRAKAQRTTEKALVTFAQSRVSEAEAQVQVATTAVREAEAQEGIAVVASREAIARVSVQKAQLDQVKATLEKTEVKAPFDGVVVLKDAEVGEVVSPNSQGGNSRGSVVTMVDYASLEVQVDLPEKSLSAVELGTRANIYLDAYPKVRFTGEVKRIWPTANRQKGSVELRIVFDELDPRLRPEMGVRVVFRPKGEQDETPAEAGDAVVLVPESCVVTIDGQRGVFEVDRDRVRWRPVRTGARRDARVVVESGLAGGETLVARPPTELKDGARVRVE